MKQQDSYQKVKFRLKPASICLLRERNKQSFILVHIYQSIQRMNIQHILFYYCIVCGQTAERRTFGLLDIRHESVLQRCDRIISYCPMCSPSSIAFQHRRKRSLRFKKRRNSGSERAQWLMQQHTIAMAMWVITTVVTRARVANSLMVMVVPSWRMPPTTSTTQKQNQTWMRTMGTPSPGLINLNLTAAIKGSSCRQPRLQCWRAWITSKQFRQWRLPFTHSMRSRQRQWQPPINSSTDQFHYDVKRELVVINQ